jgi:hypothetical protein
MQSASVSGFGKVLICIIAAVVVVAYFIYRWQSNGGDLSIASNTITYKDSQTGFQIQYPQSLGVMKQDETYRGSYVAYDLNNVKTIDYYRNPSSRPVIDSDRIKDCPQLSHSNKESNPVGDTDVCFMVPLKLDSTYKGYILEGHASDSSLSQPQDYVKGYIVSGQSVILEIDYVISEGANRLTERAAATDLLQGVSSLPVPTSDFVSY